VLFRKTPIVTAQPSALVLISTYPAVFILTLRAANPVLIMQREHLDFNGNIGFMPEIWAYEAV
jgi:hypothetical protein